MDPALVSTGVAPTLGQHRRRSGSSAVSTPGSNRFNGAFQAGQGINDQLQDGTAFRISPRVGFVYDLTGKGETIVRGGCGIFYDRPQGNMVFDMIANAPGRARAPRCSGAGSRICPSAGGDPNPTLSLNPTAFDFKPPKVTQWNVGVQHKLLQELHLRPGLRRLRVEGPAAPGADQRGAARRHVPAAEPGSDARAEQRRRARPRCPTTCCGRTRATATSGCGTTAATRTTTRCRPGVNRRFDERASCSRPSTSGARRWASTTTTSRPGVPNAELTEEARRLDYSYCWTTTARTTSWSTSSTRCRQGRERRARRARERLADLGHLPLDERPPVRRRLLDSGHRRREPDRHRRQPERARRAHLRPGPRLERRPVPSSSTRRASRRRSRAATAPSRRASSCALRRSTTSTCRSRRTFGRRQGDPGSRSGSTCSTRSTTRSSRASTTP